MPPVLVKAIPAAKLEEAALNINNGSLVKPANPTTVELTPVEETTPAPVTKNGDYFPIQITVPTGPQQPVDPNAETEEQKRKRMIYIIGGVLAALIVLLLVIVLMKKSK